MITGFPWGWSLASSRQIQKKEFKKGKIMFKKISHKTFWKILIGLIILGISIPCGSAFVLDSVTFKIDEAGNADATVNYQLQGIVESAIPDAMLQSELQKGLTTDPANPPTLTSFSRSEIVLMMPKYASKTESGSATTYATNALNFSKAEVALKNSALNYLISADFTPSVVKIEFPDGYTETLNDVGYLPSITHSIPSERSSEQIDSIAVQKTPASATIIPATTDTSPTDTPTNAAPLSPITILIALAVFGGALILFRKLDRE